MERECGRGIGRIHGVLNCVFARLLCM
jgi:hypothetical protein